MRRTSHIRLKELHNASSSALPHDINHSMPVEYSVITKSALDYAVHQCSNGYRSVVGEAFRVLHAVDYYPLAPMEIPSAPVGGIKMEDYDEFPLYGCLIRNHEKDNIPLPTS